MSPRNENAIWSGLFQISVDSGQTLQAQIRQAVVTAILDRQISVSMPLPSCRVLAQKLGVARGTVVLAFQQLVDQGFLIARERRGHFVNPEVLALPEKPLRKKPVQQKSGLDWAARKQMSADAFPQLQKPENWIKFSYPFVYGQFDPTLFPTAEWRECNRMALAVLEIRDWASDMFDRDDPLLIEQIQARLLPRRGIFVSPDEIMVTLGAQHALYMLASLLMKRGTRVAVEDPGYIDARNIFRLLGAETVPVPVDGNGLRVSEVPEDSDFVFVTPSHQCPTMVSLPTDRRKALLKAADDHDQVIIEDDYDSQLFDDAPQPALKSLDSSGRVIYVGSMSKTLAPGLRLGYIVGSPDLIAELRVLRRYMLRHPPSNNQRAVALFLSLGHHDALVRKLSQAFNERRNRLVDAVANHLPEWNAGSATSGTSVWLEGPQGTDTKKIAEAAAARSVLVEPGDIFFTGASKPTNYMRLGISSIAGPHIEPGIRQLATAAGRRPAAA